MNSLNTRMPTTTRREIAHRFASLGLATRLRPRAIGGRSCADTRHYTDLH